MRIQKHTKIQPSQRSRHYCQQRMDRGLFFGEEEISVARLQTVISTYDQPSRFFSPDNLLQMLFFYVANELRALELLILKENDSISYVDKMLLFVIDYSVFLSIMKKPK